MRLSGFLFCALRLATWPVGVVLVGNVFVGTVFVGTVFVLFGLALTPAHGQQSDTDEQRFRRAAELAGQALADLESGNCRTASERFTEVERLLPDNLLPKVNLAICAFQANEPERALAWLERATQLAPDSPEALFATARVLEGGLDDEPARRRWQQTLRRFAEAHPDDPRPRYLRGLVATREDQHAVALEHYLEAIERSPENLALLLARLGAAARSGNLDQTSDGVDAVEDRLDGFDARAQRFTDQLRDALFAEDATALAPPAIVLQNLLRPTDLYRVGLTELIGPGDGTQMFAQTDFMPALPKSIQGGQDIEIVWRDRTAEWISVQAGFRFPSRSGERDGLWALSAEVAVELVGAEAGPTRLANADPWPASGSVDAATTADLDQDGLADVVVTSGTRLYMATRKEGSDDSALGAARSLQLPAPATTIRAADLDQEGDIDLLVLHQERAPTFLLNRGSGGLAVEPLEIGELPASDARLVDLDDDGDLDVVLARAGAVAIFENLRGGSYRDATERLLVRTVAADRLAIADFNQDGKFDILVWQGDDSDLQLLENRGDALSPRTVARGRWLDAHPLDFDNDGDDDIAVLEQDGDAIKAAVLRNRREQGFDPEPVGRVRFTAGAAASIRGADLDQDGDLDLLAANQTNTTAFENQGGESNQWLRVRLVGLNDNNSKNNILGVGAKVEVRAGGAYQAKLADGGVAHFGLGSTRRAEVLRVLWTNGLAQTQQQVSSRQTLTEKQVLKGSCPFLYTWDGSGFSFHTDLLWRSTLGMTFADGSPAPHQSAMDWVLIPGDRLVAAGDRYWLATTAELWETIYLDRQQLLVVDYPANAQLVVDETFRRPPHPTEPPLHWVVDERSADRALDHTGRDVSAVLQDRDDQRVDQLPLTRYQGATDEHWIELEFSNLPPKAARTLLLWGWIFPTDTSINVSLSQDPGLSTSAPRLEVFSDGAWRVASTSLGLPMGKRKATVVPLDPLLTPAEHQASSLRLRVSTTMQIYWNKASLSLHERSGTDHTAPMGAARLSALEPEQADLHYRGFSAMRARRPSEPHLFDYERVDTGPRFRDLVGTYTSYGDVRKRLRASDDSLVLMNAGDELIVSYRTDQLPELPTGWRRDFVLHSDGWVKDADVHTAFSQTVEPIPYHGMPNYRRDLPDRGDDGTESSATGQRSQAHATSRMVSDSAFVEAVSGDAGEQPRPR